MRFPRPGNCPVCGLFCSVRWPHDCVPPEPLRAAIPYTGVSPFMAWPASHRYRRDDRVWLRTPVRGVGPRMLALIARHRSQARRDLASGRRARYGPAHALTDLVEGGLSAVLQEVAAPSPAWVPCARTWHRVRLQDGDLVLMDHAELDLEAEEIAAALSGEPMLGCVAALGEWRRRHRLRRLTLMENLAALDAAASYPSELEKWDAWAAARVSRASVSAFDAIGVSAPELLRWVPWERRVEEVARWRAVGWTADEARALSQVLARDDDGRDWRDRGLSASLTVEAVANGLDAHQTGDWWDLRFRPSVAAELQDMGVDVVRARDLVAELGTAGRVTSLFLVGPVF